MRKNGNLQEATMRALLSETVQADKEDVWNYIIDDVHHLEDFTDIEICSKEDNEIAYDVAKANLNKFTTGEIREMANEIASGNIDLVNWGHKVLESKKVEAKLEADGSNQTLLEKAFEEEVIYHLQSLAMDGVKEAGKAMQDGKLIEKIVDELVNKSDDIWEDIFLRIENLAGIDYRNK